MKRNFTLNSTFGSLIKTAGILFFIYSPTFIHSQTITSSVNIVQLVETKKIVVKNRDLSLINEDQKKGIHLNGKPGDGVAWLTNSDFTEGIISFDVRGKDLMQQSFVGIAFNGINDTTYDVVYFRPFNFQSQDVVRKSHSVQYVSLPAWDWERLRNEFPGKYENAINPAPAANDWLHCDVKIKNGMVYVYVNNITEPSLTVKIISTTSKGKIGFWVGNNSDGDFANLSLSITKN